VSFNWQTCTLSGELEEVLEEEEEEQEREMQDGELDLGADREEEGKASNCD
jgi:hypothetical protein